MIIAVDGPTASGKGTLAKQLADHFGVPHLDTGLLYRAVGQQVAIAGGDPDNEADALAACTFPDVLLEDPALRSEGSGSLASKVSVHPAVREALFERQRAFATQTGGAVLDGRDIGTVIAPDAVIKLFITASIEERARRRFLELSGRGIETTQAETAEDISRRDARDMNRTDAPLFPAQDAMIIDTTAFDKEQAFEAVLDAVKMRLSQNP
ncbi:MAG: (d)CMP kinase [Erythrobacter sp.]